MSSAEEFKQQGNAAFGAKEYGKAIDLFTKAIQASQEPNHVLYSNRSAAYASARQFDKALVDAQECIKLKPDWAKGYVRLATAQYNVADYEECAESYAKALELEPSNKAAMDGSKQVKSVLERRSNSETSLLETLMDPNLVEKLTQNPKTSELMKNPVYKSKIESMKTNPMAFFQDLFTDPVVFRLLSTLQGVKSEDIDTKFQEMQQKFSMFNDTKGDSGSEVKTEPKNESRTSETKTETKAEPEAMEVDEEPQQESSEKQAEEEKQKGNVAYKARKFDEAIEHYNKAWELHNDITYLNNRSAAEFEKGEFETAISTLQEAIDKGREMRTDYKVIAKSFARMGNAYKKQGDLKKAIDYYQKSLTEHRTPDTLTKLRNAEKELKKQEAEAYVDPEKAEEARLQGKEYFTKGDWPNAVKAYTEMIKRSPDDARGYSNRAAALAKLMSFPEAIADCDQAIAKDGNFVRAYIRKASAQIAVKEYASAIETLSIAGERDREVNNGQNQREIEQLYMKASQQRFEPANANESAEETYARAMRDPEVQKIMQDPVMQSILQQAQNNPKALQDHMRNPDVFKKIQTLIAAGIIRTG